MDWLNNLEARCFPAPEVERQLGVGDETPALPPTKAQMRQVIAAVRLVEKEAAEATWELQNEVDPVKIEARLDELVRCLRSGEMEGNPPPKDKPAPSEDEGEKWGRLLWELMRRTASGREDWCVQNETTRGRYRVLALRFRAKCVKEFEEVVRAARAYLGVMGGDGTDGDGAEEYHYLEVALSALPDLGEAPEDKSPPSST